MGRTYNTLRTNGHVAPHAQPASPPPVPFEDSGLEVVCGPDVPFIEIGPKRAIVEASPDVLAVPLPAAPAGHPAAPSRQGVSLRPLHEPKKSRFAPDLVAFHAPHVPTAAQYGDLLTALIDAARQRPGKCQTLLFTGVRTQAGCTTALLNVAITAARNGFKVAAIDANLRRPAVAARLGLQDAPGLAEVLSGESELHDALCQTEQDGLTALTAGAPAPVLADVNALADVVASVRELFVLVLIDGPRWDGRAGCMTLAKLADAVFLVSPVAEADAPPASELRQTLLAEGVPLAGTVLTNG